MPKSINQKSKLLYVLRYLEEHTDAEHPASVEDIIAHLASCGISAERKSIYSDIEALATFGADIEKCRSKTVGYYIASRTFELPELKLLVDAVQSSKFITEKKSRALIKKIVSLTSEHEAKQLDRQVNVADRIKTANESIYYTVDDIHRAIAEDKKISFKYFEWSADKEKVLRRNGESYTVSPYTLVWDDENYYLIGRDGKTGENRHFRVDKMLHLDLLDERRDMSSSPKDGVANYSKKLFGMFGGTEQMVTLSCQNAFAGVIIDRFGTDVAFKKAKGDSSLEVSVKVVLSPVFYSWLTSFEGKIKLVSPESAVADYREFISKSII